MATTVGRPVARDLQQSFKRGLNTTADESQLRPDEVREAENARLTEYGGVSKRLGTQRIHDTALDGPVRAGFTWRKPSPASHLVIANGHLYTAPHGSYPLTVTDQGTGLDPTAHPSLTSFRDTGSDVVYIADGDLLSKWDGTTFTLDLPGTPNVRRLAVHNSRLFGCGDPANPETLYHSGLQNGDTLGSVPGGGGATIIRTFAHEPLTALLAVGQSLLLFHERGISRFTGWGQDDFNVSAGTRGVTQDVGTIAPNSVVGIENVGFFASDRGFYAVTESGVTQISAAIESIIAATPASDLALVSAAHARAFREVWFCIPDRGVLVYNYRLKAWSGPYRGTYETASPCVLWDSDDNNRPLVLFGGADGFVRQADTPQLFRDDVLADGTGGVPIVMSVLCHRMFFRDPASEKALRWIYVTTRLRGSAGTVVGWETGEETGSVALQISGTAALWGLSQWNAFTWGPGGSRTERLPAWGRGRYCDVRLVDDGISNPVFSRVEVSGFDMSRR